MTYALSGSTITQSGTDTSYAGLNGIAGVTRLSTGDGFLYYMPTLILSVTGTLTIVDPSKDTFICANLSVAGTGTYKSGSFAVDGVTPLYSGTHFQCVTGAILSDSFNFGGSIQVATGGKFTTIGGQYIIAGSVYYQVGAIVREYVTTVVSSMARGTNSNRIRAYSSDVIKRNCRHFDVGYDMFRMPTEFSVKAFGSVYVSQYVGSTEGYPGVHAKFVASALSNTDGTAEFDNWGGGWVELYNCLKGINLIIVNSANRASHCVPLYQDINITATDLSGVAQQNVRLKCVDSPVSNSPVSTITTEGALKTWDFRNAQTYTATTNASGKVSISPVLQVWYGTNNLKNLRFPASTATIRLVGYAVRQQDIQVVLGADAAIEKSVAMITANDITLTETQAGALTGIAFAAIGATGGVITITGSCTAAEIWQTWRYWKGLIANTGSDDSWEFSGTTLNISSWSLVNNSTITGSINTTDTITGTGSITGIYKSSSGTSAQLMLTNLTADSTVLVTNGSGTSYEYLSILGTSYTLNISPGATGVWTWRVAKYGFKTTSGTFSPGVGGLFSNVVSLIPDSQISDTLSNVQTYTDVNVSQEIYDWIALYNCTAAGMASPKTLTLTATALNIGNLTLAKNGTLGLSGNTLTTGSSTMSGVNIITSGTQSTTGLPDLTYPQQFTDSTGITNWFEVVLSTGSVSQDSFNNTYSTASYKTFIPASFTSNITLVVTKRGYKKQSIVIQYSQSLLPKQTPVLIPDPGVVDLVTDYVDTLMALINEDQIYDTYSQYQATQSGILDTYTPVKSFGAIDFISESITFTPTATSTIERGVGTLKFNVGTVTSGIYYSTNNITFANAELSNNVKIRSSNSNSELVFDIDSIKLFPTEVDRNTGANGTDEIFNGIKRFLYGELIQSVTMSGSVFTLANVNGIKIYHDIVVVTGENKFDLGTVGRLVSINNALNSKPTLAQIEASAVLAKQSGFTGLATSANVTSAQTAIVDKVNQNEVKIDTLQTTVNIVKSKTDQLTFTGVNLNSIAQVVADKTGYTLTELDKTNIAAIVEQSILDDSDGRAILNAIVNSIGNQNLDQIALVAAVRADLERTGGLLKSGVDTQAKETTLNSLIAGNNLRHNETQQTLSTIEIKRPSIE